MTPELLFEYGCVVILLGVIAIFVLANFFDWS